jgi:hypothetical protein
MMKYRFSFLSLADYRMCCLQFGASTGAKRQVKYFNQAKCLPKYVLSCAHISFKISVSVIQITRGPQTTSNAPQWGGPHSLVTSCLVTEKAS